MSLIYPEDSVSGNKVLKIVNLRQTTNILRGNLEFNYYDYSNIYDDLNYKKVYSLFKELFECDNIFYDNYDVNISDEVEINKDYFLIFYELGILNRETINFKVLNDFYKNELSLKDYLINTTNQQLLNKFDSLLHSKIKDHDSILKIKQLLGIEEKIIENKLILDRIQEIYQQYDIIYICIACGKEHKVPYFFINEVSNIKKTAIIYISELTDNSMGPFWLSKNDKQYYVTEDNMFNTFDDVSQLLRNKLDVYIFEFRIPDKMDYFFNRLSSIINKKTLLYIGFRSGGSITNEYLTTFLFKISQNPNIIYYVYGKLPKIGIFKDLDISLMLNSYPPELVRIFVDFLLAKPIENLQKKYLKYKHKYLLLKNYIFQKHLK
jgi:hypothetical protein